MQWSDIIGESVSRVVNTDGIFLRMWSWNAISLELFLEDIHIYVHPLYFSLFQTLLLSNEKYRKMKRKF